MEALQDHGETPHTNPSVLYFRAFDVHLLYLKRVFKFCRFLDVGGVQISSNPEEGVEGQAGHDAALCAQTA